MNKKELLKMITTSLEEEKDKWKIIKKNDWSGEYENKKKGITIFMDFFSFKVSYGNQTYKFGFLTTMFKVDHLLPPDPNTDISELDVMDMEKQWFPDIP